MKLSINKRNYQKERHEVEEAFTFPFSVGTRRTVILLSTGLTQKRKSQQVIYKSLFYKSASNSVFY